jgi:hypothetical protein
MKYYVVMAMLFAYIAIVGVENNNFGLLFSGIVPLACCAVKISRLEIEEQHRKKEYDN